MRRRLLATIAALGAAGLAAGAVPAFTADNGTVSVSVTALAPAGACLTLDPGALEYGSLAFSRSILSTEAERTATATNCNTTRAHFLDVSATDATGPSGDWNLSGSYSGAGMCFLGPNEYALLVEPGRVGSPVGGRMPLSTTPNRLGDGAGGLAGFGANSSEPLDLVLAMPCEGSNGAGEAKTLSVTFMAVQI